jgi:hypothetical protein
MGEREYDVELWKESKSPDYVREGKERNAPSSRHPLQRLSRRTRRSVHPSLDPVQPLCRPRVRLVPLPPDRQLHRMLPAPQRSDRAVVRDVGATSTAEIFFEDEIGEGVGGNGRRIAGKEGIW